ncbi:MAG: zinc-ribbon domain-containing protein [Acidobacteria bacterium]|nr:zinc-ribbon domain-containing protein [Acidobacteriota bacterium]
MGLTDFFKKQFIDVINWTEPEDGILAYRFPMEDMEIQNGAVLTVRESQGALFVNEGQAADAFGPGRHTLSTQTLPLLTNLKNWDKLFQSPFKSDVYFFSTRQQLNQKWGTQQPVTIRDREFGAIRLRAFGIYSFHLNDVRKFHQKVSGTRDIYRAAEIEGQLRNTIIARMSDAFAESGIPFLDMAANQTEMADKIAEHVRPAFADLGLTLDTFLVENLSMPEELQKILDQRISMNIVGDMGRYTQFQVAQSIPIAAANEGGIAGVGAGLGAGFGIAQQMAGAMQGAWNQPAPQAPPPPAAPAAAVAAGAAAVAGGETKFCMNCGSKIPRAAKFCAECGTAQG